MKKWPAIYYASKKDCKDLRLRQCNPKKARRKKVYGWRSWDNKS